MRENAVIAGDRSNLSTHESMVHRRQNFGPTFGPTKASRPNLVFKEHVQMAESNSAVQSKLATVSSGKPDVKSFPQKTGRIKTASAVDALRCTLIPGPKTQRRLPGTFVAKTEADKRSQSAVNHSAILNSTRTKSTKAKSLSLIADVITGCRIPEPARNGASFARKSIGEASASQPEGKGPCKSGSQMKEDQVASQRKQVKSPPRQTPVVPVNKTSRVSAVQKLSRLPNAGLDRVSQSCVSTTSSKLSIVNHPGENSHKALASGKEAANSSSYTVPQSSFQRQASREPMAENSNNSPSFDLQLADRASGISSITPDPPRGSNVLEDTSLEGSSISGKQIVGQRYNAKAFSFAKSITGSVLAEPCIEIKCWTTGDQAEHRQSLHCSEIEIIPHNTGALSPIDHKLRDADSFTHDDSQMTESHREQDSCTVCTSDRFSLKDDGHNPSGGLMAPNWNVLKLDLENDSPLESPVEPSRASLTNKTSDGIGKDGPSNEIHLSANQASHITTKRSLESINFAASNEKSETRSSRNTTKKKQQQLIRSNATPSSVLSTFSDIIQKRNSYSPALSVGIHDRNKDVSISGAPTKGSVKKCPQVKRGDLSKEGFSSTIKACPFFCSNQSSKTSDQLPQVKKKELLQESLPSKMKSCQEPDPNTNKFSGQLMSDQLTSQNPYNQSRDSKTIASQRHLRKCLQSNDVDTPALQRRGGEKETEVKNSPLENLDEKVLPTTAFTNHSHREAETKMSKSAESYKETNSKTSVSEKEGHKGHTELTKLWSNGQESTELLSPKQCKGQSDAQKITPEFLCHKEAHSGKATQGNKTLGETDLKKVTFEDKCHKGTDSRKVTFENRVDTKTELVKSTSGNEFRKETKSQIETTKDQLHKEKSDAHHSLSPADRNRQETLSESVTLENNVEKDFEIVVLKSQSRQKKHPQKEASKGKSEKKISLPGNNIKRREQKTVRQANPSQNTNLTNLLATIHGDNSGRQVVPITSKLAAQGGCPFKRLHNIAGSGAKSPSTKSQFARAATPPKKSSIAEPKQDLGFLEELDDMEEEMKTLVKEFKALEKGDALLTSSSDYDSDTSLPSSSSPPSSSSAATSSADFIRSESRRLSVIRDEGIRRRWLTAKFFKFLPVLSPAQKLLPRIPQNKRDPSEWLRAQTALETHREATTQQPKRTSSETSYLTPSSNTTDNLPDSFARANDATATPNRYPKISDIRFHEAPNLDLCAVNAADNPNFWVTLFVEMPTRTNTTVYNIKIELTCCALRAFFDPCDRIKFAYVRSVREKLTELIQDGLARPKFDEFVCCERYDCVLVLSLDAGALLRHPKTSFVYSLSAVLEVEPNRVLVLVSTDS